MKAVFQCMPSDNLIRLEIKSVKQVKQLKTKVPEGHKDYGKDIL